MRLAKFLLPGLMAWALAGCSTYHLGPANGAISGEKSVEVMPFNNQTLHPWLGDAVTQALRERLQSDGTYRLATSGQGDVVLTGVIHGYDRQALSYLNTDTTTPDNYMVNIIVHVIAKERASGKVILDKEVKGHTLVHVSDDLASAERQAMPLLADDLSQNITELLTEGAW